MRLKPLFIICFMLLLIYPLWSLFRLHEVMTNVGSGIGEAETALNTYQRSIWISWIILVSMAVYYKWVRKKNRIFYLTYAFLVVSFAVFGMYVQQLVNDFDVPSNFNDSYTLGIFTAIQNILVSGLLTGFLQAGVWWFTRRWHRR